MATFSFYNHTAQLFQSGQIAATDTFKVVLLNSSATFDATDTTVAEVTSTGTNEVSGNGWASSGVTLSGVTITSVNTNDSMLDATDVSVAITGGDLGPFSAYVIVDTTITGSAPLGHILLDSATTILENNNAVIAWNANGIIRITA